jgi:2-oxoglutarate ferredoxin oxidoreductase subunit gamma
LTERRYLIVGHGGQGVLDLGNFVAYNAVMQGLHIAYTPSYGPETRGGKVRCYVVKSSEQIDSPIVDEPDVLVAMNNPSMDFEASVNPKGTLLMNTSLIDRPATRDDLEVVSVPATELAEKLKDPSLGIPDTRVLQNSVAYGALMAVEGQSFDKTVVQQILQHVYGGNKARFVPANMLAMQRGFDYLRGPQGS